MRILIIDDELLIVKAMTSILTAAGHEVVGKAGSLDAGLKIADETVFDLAILDVNLNGQVAEPLIVKIQERGIPILLVSGYTAKQQTGRAQYCQLLDKPFTPEDLLKAVAANQN